MLVLAREVHHLRHLGLGDFIGEHAALANPMVMNVQHDLGGGLDVLLEEPFQDENDELHRSIVVIQDQDAIKIRALGLWLDLGDDGSSRTAGASGAVFVIAHSGRRGRERGRKGWVGSGSELQHGTGVRTMPTTHRYGDRWV